MANRTQSCLHCNLFALKQINVKLQTRHTIDLRRWKASLVRVECESTAISNSIKILTEKSISHWFLSRSKFPSHSPRTLYDITDIVIISKLTMQNHDHDLGRVIIYWNLLPFIYWFIDSIMAIYWMRPPELDEKTKA